MQTIYDIAKAHLCIRGIRIFLLVIGLMIAQRVCAQPSESINRIDSLKTKISQLSTKDPEYARLASLHAQMCFEDLRVVDGLEAVKKLRRLAEESDNERTLGYYYEAMGFLHAYSSLKEFNQIKADWILNKHHEFDLWGNIEGSKNIKDDTAGVAIQTYEQALSHYQALNDTFSIRHLHAELASMYRWWKLPGNTYKDTEEIRNYVAHRDAALGLSDIPEELSLNLEMKCSQLADLWFQQINQTSEMEVSLANLVLNINDAFDRAWGYYKLGSSCSNNNRNFLALNYNTNSIELLEQLGETNLLSFCYYSAGVNYQRAAVRQPDLNDKAVENSKKAILLHQQMKFTKGIEKVYSLYVSAKRRITEDQAVPDSSVTTLSATLGIPDSINQALDRYFKYLGNNLTSRLNRQLFAFHLQREAQIQNRKGNKDKALTNNMRALNLLLSIDDYRGSSISSILIAQGYREKKEYAKALRYALDGYQYATETTWTPSMISGSALLANLYEEMGQLRNAIEYLKINQRFIAESERLNSQIQFAEMEVANILKESQREIERLDAQRKLIESENENQRIILAAVGVILVILLIFSFVIYRGSLARKRTNELLSQQRDELQNTLLRLQSTQSQLIQSEKMASLGELTAGIAHEIQNPLNFVNNFSEVNTELIRDLKSEIEKGNFDEVKSIARDIESNEEKIVHHGKRADAIVKGMLQHSRGSNNIKEPTDINALADEYLRLAYHGLRAKDKSFNAKFETNFDPNLPQVNVVPQDIGRVILNLITNAFYAVNEKAQSQNGNYEPAVSISTREVGDKIEIKVSDNGNGIPDSVKDKIFQPFFTTKPTGQGTGLGLSMSYDIVTKGHGGQLLVESSHGAGTTFKIILENQ